MLFPFVGSIESADSVSDVPLQDLLRLVAQRSPKHFRQLYDRTSPQVYGRVFSVVRDVHRAEKITERVYFDVWWRAAEFDESVGTVGSWMMLLTRARLIDDLRHNRLERAGRPAARAQSMSPAEAWVRSLRRAGAVVTAPGAPASAA